MPAIHFLSEDLWARIFDALQTSAVENVLEYRYYADADSVAAGNKSMSRYYQLPSTCWVFECNTGLYACLHMREGLPHTATVSLLFWLRKHGSCVHTLVSSCGSPTADINLEPYIVDFRS